MNEFALYSIGGFAFWVGLFLLANKAKSNIKIKNADVLNNVMDGLNVLVNGFMFKGSESKIVYKDKISWNQYGNYGAVQYLCKTKNNHWYLLDIEVGNEKIIATTIKPITEDYAKAYLSDDIKVYREYFGEPEVA